DGAGAAGRRRSPAAGPRPGPAPPVPPPAPGVARATPWPGRAPTPPPPDTPLATVAVSPLPRPAPTGDVPGEPVIDRDESTVLDAIVLAEGRPSVDVGATTGVGGSTERGAGGAAAEGARPVSAGEWTALLAAIGGSEGVAAARWRISTGRGETPVRGAAPSPLPPPPGPAGPP